MIGKEFSPATDWSPQSEDIHWIGRPWRRITLLTHRDYWKGEEIDRSRDVTLHLGLRRLGLHFTLSVGKQAVLDYSEERP